MMKRLLYNWEYKLIALLLAISLYFYTSDLITINRRLVIPVLSEEQHILSTPDDYVVTAIEPMTEIDVYITGPRKIVQNLEEQIELGLTIDKSAIRDGMQVFAINNSFLDLDPKIKIEELRPTKNIIVKVSRQIYRTVPINTELTFIGLPETLLVPEIKLDKTDLEVFGPEELVSELESLAVEPVDLSTALAASPEIRIALEKVVPIKLKLPQGVRTTDSTTVYAEFILRPKMASREMNLPVSVLAEPEFATQYRVEFASPVITVTVNGPASYLDELKEDQLTAFVNISADQFSDASSKRLPVYVRNPSWVSVSPSQVMVTLKKRTVVDKTNLQDSPKIITPEVKHTPPDDDQPIVPDDDQPILERDDRKPRSILPED